MNVISTHQLEMQERRQWHQVEMAINENVHFQNFLTCNLQIKNEKAYLSLRNALTDHIWDHYEGNYNEYIYI